MYNTMYGAVQKSYPHLWWDQKCTFEQVFKAFLCKLQCYFLVKTSSQEKPMDVNPWISNCQLNCSSRKHHLFPIKQRNQNAPVNMRKYKFLIFTSMFRQVLDPANAINSFAKSLFPFFGLDCAQKHRSRLCLPFLNLLKIEKWCPSILSLIHIWRCRRAI